MDAVEQVCNAHDDLGVDLLAGLESLLNKSLLRRSEIGQKPNAGHFSMLETIREYALERLVECGEAEAIRRLHAEFYVALVEAASEEMGGPHPEIGYDRVEAVRDNLRTALHWARESGETVMALRMVAVLYGFWYQRGYISEGRAELEATLAISEGVDSVDRAKALYGAGRLAIVQNDYASARSLLLQSLETARRLGENEEGGRAVADALGGLGLVADYAGDYASARQYAEERLAISQAVGYGPGISGALMNLGGVALDEGNYELARCYYQEVVEFSRKRGDRGKEGSALVNLGVVAEAAGDHNVARALLGEALVIWQERGNKLGRATTLHNRGDVARGEGDNSQALAHYREAIGLYRELGNKASIARALPDIAGVLSELGLTECAALLLGAATRLLFTLKYNLLPASQAAYERTLASCKEALGPERFDMAWGEGQAMSFDEAVALALVDAD